MTRRNGSARTLSPEMALVQQELEEMNTELVITTRTQEAYRYAFEHYRAFCQVEDLPPFEDDSLIQYIAAAYTGDVRTAETCRPGVPLSPSTLDHWVGGVRLVWAEEGQGDPFRDGDQAVFLRQVRHGYGRAVRRLIGPPRKAVPLTPELLRPMLTAPQAPRSYGQARRTAVVYLHTTFGLGPAAIARISPELWTPGAIRGHLRIPGRAKPVRVPCSADHLACPNCALTYLAAHAQPGWCLFEGVQKPRMALVRANDAAYAVSRDLRKVRAVGAADSTVLLWQAGSAVQRLRDCTMLLVAFHLGLRTMDVLGLRRGDVRRRADHYEVVIRGTRHRRDTIHRSILTRTREHALDPVALLDLWLLARDDGTNACAEDAPLFCHVDRNERITSDQSLQYWELIEALHRLEDAAGLPRQLSGHSMRVGYAELASAQGATSEQIAAQLRVKYTRTAERYATSLKRGGAASTRLRSQEQP